MEYLSDLIIIFDFAGMHFEQVIATLPQPACVEVMLAIWNAGVMDAACTSGA